MTQPDASEVVVRFIEDVLNGGRVELVSELVASDFVSHGWGADQCGTQGVAAFAAEQRRLAPDWHIAIEEVIVSGDRVVVRARGEGTPYRPIAGLRPPKRRVELPWIAIYRVAAGRIAERWTAVDVEAVVGQYGAKGV